MIITFFYKLWSVERRVVWIDLQGLVMKIKYLLVKTEVAQGHSIGTGAGIPAHQSILHTDVLNLLPTKFSTMVLVGT